MLTAATRLANQEAEAAERRRLHLLAYPPDPSFHPFPRLPPELQILIWKHALHNPALHDDFRFSVCDDTGDDVLPEFFRFRGEFARCALGRRCVSITTRGGRVLYVIEYAQYGGDMHALKAFWDVISSHRLARQVGLEWWREEMVRGETQFDRGVYDELHEEGQDWWREEDDPAMAITREEMEGWKGRALEVLGEAIEDVKRRPEAAEWVVKKVVGKKKKRRERRVT